MGEKESKVLSYAVEAGLETASWRVASRFPRIPSVVLGVGVLVFFHLMLYFGLDHFIFRDVFDRIEIYTIVAAVAPILIQRRGWRPLMLAIGIIVVLSMIRLIGFFTYKFALNGYIQTFAPAAILALLVACVWILPMRRDKARTIIDACLLAITIGIIMIAFNDFFWDVFGYDDPGYATRGLGFAYSHIFLPYVLIVVIWFGIPFIGGDRGDFRSASLVTYYSLFAMVTAACAFYLFFLRIWVAGYSLDTGFPFDRAASANTMAYYGTPNARYWHALDRADWSPPISEMGPGADWRNIAIYYLLLHDPGAPKRLAGMLVAHPKRIFADSVADGVAKAGVYDAVPIFLRYALVVEDDKCTSALITLGVPQAAWVVFGYAIHEGNLFHGTPKLSPIQRSEMVSLLGADAGDDPYAWEKLLGEKAKGPKPPIPTAITSEADEVVRIISAYGNANLTLKKRRGDRAAQLAAAAGLTSELQLYYDEAHQNKLSESDAYRFLGEGLDNIVDRATKEMDMKGPDWDAVDTASLRREVEEFGKRVAALPVLQVPSTKASVQSPAETQPYSYFHSVPATQSVR